VRGCNASLICRAALRGKLVEEPGFGLHNKSRDFWAVTYRQAMRCCCEASQGPDGQGREMCRHGSRQRRSAPHPPAGLLLIHPLSEIRG